MSPSPAFFINFPESCYAFLIGKAGCSFLSRMVFLCYLYEYFSLLCVGLFLGFLEEEKTSVVWPCAAILSGHLSVTICSLHLPF